jgi:acyl-CoA thioesterase FadM
MGGRWSDGWYVVPHQAIFRDLDAIGHVNNAVFFTYFEWARALFWFDLTGGSRPFDLGFIVARAECDFRRRRKSRRSPFRLEHAVQGDDQ